MNADLRSEIREMLAEIVEMAREEIPTAPDHAIPHHRADEAVRDLLEEVIHA